MKYQQSCMPQKKMILRLGLLQVISPTYDFNTQTTSHSIEVTMTLPEAEVAATILEVKRIFRLSCPFEKLIAFLMNEKYKLKILKISIKSRLISG